MESPEPMLQFFVFAHLPAHLKEVSWPFALLAEHLVETLPRNPERTVALRKLLEAKDCAVRSALWDPCPAIEKVAGVAGSLDPSVGYIPAESDNP